MYTYVCVYIYIYIYTYVCTTHGNPRGQIEPQSNHGRLFEVKPRLIAGPSPPRMQCVLRAAIAQVSRGLSTGLVLVAGARCPDCLCSPSLVCTEPPSCGDCSCRDGRPTPEISQAFLVTAGLILILFGYLLGRLHALPCVSIIGEPPAGKGKRGLWLKDGSSFSGRGSSTSEGGRL